jgi:hypothetical protein
MLGEVEGVDAVTASHRETLWYQIDAEHLRRAAVPGDASTHLTDGPEADHGNGSAGGDARVVDGLPGGREDIGEEQELLV